MKTQVRSSSAEPVSLDDTNTVYTVHNRALEDLLFDRNLVELPFRRACLRASRLFLRHVGDELPTSGVSELLILSKGVAYQLAESFALEFQKNLPTNMVATRRARVSGDTAKIDVPYSRFDAGGDTLIIGDTIASGASVIAALEEYRLYHRVTSVYLLSYAGSGLGARRILEYCRAAEIRVTMLYGLAAFGLADNGFDLSFLHPDTIARPGYTERAARQFDGKAISSVGWDFGAQSIAPEKYRQLCYVERQTTGASDTVFHEVSQPSSLDILWREKAAFEARLEADISDVGVDP
jgi:hypothetical protein